MKTLYGIHEGSIHEGGGSHRKVFASIDKAREYALEKVAEHEAGNDRVYADDPEDRPTPLKESPEYPNAWRNELDEIFIYDVELID